MAGVRATGAMAFTRTPWGPHSRARLLRDPALGRLHSGVHGQVGGSLHTGGRREQDHGAGPAAEVRQRGPRTPEGRGRGGGNLGTDRVAAGELHRTGRARRRHRVVDHHVEPAEAFDGLGYRGLDFAGGGHVAAHEDGFVPGGPDRLGDGLAGGRPPGGDHHRRAGVGQRSSDAGADALAGTGHQRDLAVEHSDGLFRGHPVIQAPPSMLIRPSRGAAIPAHPVIQAPPSITSDAPVRPVVAGPARLSITAAISATEGSRPSAGSCRALASTAEAACSGARNMDG